MEALLERYKRLHPKLLPVEYQEGLQEYTGTKVFEAYAYYKNDIGGVIDKGTRIRYVEKSNEKDTMTGADLPGFQSVDAHFNDGCMAAYCDHWVSNVVSRTGFIETLTDLLDFTPKVSTIESEKFIFRRFLTSHLIEIRSISMPV